MGYLALAFYFKYSGNIEPGDKSKSDIRRNYKKKSSAIGLLYKQNKYRTTPSTSLDTASGKECEMSLEKSKLNYFPKDKRPLMEFSSVSSPKTFFDFKNLPRTINFPVRYTFSAGNKESNTEVLEKSVIRTDTEILRKVSPQVLNESVHSEVEVDEIMESMKVVRTLAEPSEFDLRSKERQYVANVGLKELTCKRKHDVHEQTSTSEKMFVCDVFKKRFSNQHSLAKHHKSHSNGKIFMCDKRQEVFTRKDSLEHHKWTHTSEKCFMCDVYEKSSSRTHDIKIHYRKHTEQTLVCNICKRRFKYMSLLVIHYRTHTGEKPFKCDVCEKRFAANYYLTKHRIRHTGKRPYECGTCGRALFHKYDRNIHFKKTHR